MMKFIVLLAMLSFSCQPTPPPQIDDAPLAKPQVTEHVIERIEVQSVFFGVTTWSSISCDKFDKAFPAKEYKLVVISDKESLLEVAQRLANLKPASFKPGVDARAKALIFYRDQTVETLCIDQFHMEYNGRLVESDEYILNKLKIIKT